MISVKRLVISLWAFSLVVTGLVSSIWAMDSPIILLTSTPMPSIDQALTSTPAPPLGSVVADQIGVEMVYVPSGTFEMGVSVEVASDVCIENFPNVESPVECIEYSDDSSLTPYETTLRGFWIDRYEATNDQYQQCIDYGRCESVPEWTLAANNDPQKPIVGVSWYDALMFCNWRGARLPTEEEWEYAASGPGNNVLPWGGTRILDHISIIFEAQSVGSVPGDISWVGAYDMAHNVSEWTEDRFVPYPSYDGTWNFPIQSDLFRVVRGGSFDLGVELTFTFTRQHVFPETESPIIGIRCARSSDPRE